jgi:hypothetical protein
MGGRGMPSIDQHPPPETLVAYHEQRLSDQEAEDVREHLVACRDCTAELLGLADLLDEDGVSAAEEVSREDLDAAWQRQRERQLPIAPVVSLQDRRTGMTRRPWLPAASLGLAAALAFVVVAQWRTIERLRQPRANPPLVNLVPADSVRAGSPEVSELQFPEGAERAWVILNPGLEPDSSLYDVKIVAADGGVALSFQDLRLSEAGNFLLEIPGADLEEDSYKILLFKAGQDRMLQEFDLKVRHLL